MQVLFLYISRIWSYHTKEVSDQNIPIVLIQRWEQVINTTIIYLYKKFTININTKLKEKKVVQI